MYDLLSSSFLSWSSLCPHAGFLYTLQKEEIFSILSACRVHIFIFSFFGSQINWYVIGRMRFNFNSFYFKCDAIWLWAAIKVNDFFHRSCCEFHRWSNSLIKIICTDINLNSPWSRKQLKSLQCPVDCVAFSIVMVSFIITYWNEKFATFEPLLSSSMPDSIENNKNNVEEKNNRWQSISPTTTRVRTIQS